MDMEVDAFPPAPDAPPSPRLLPFSLIEYNDLVSTALDCSAPPPALSFSLSGSAHHLERKFSAQNLHLAGGGASRVRRLLSKLKKIVRRPRLRASRPGAGRRLSAASSIAANIDTRPASPFAGFEPYLPLVAQYERAAAYAAQPLSSPPSESAHSHTHSYGHGVYASYPPPSPTVSCFSSTPSHWHPASASASECSSGTSAETPPSPMTPPAPRPWSVLTVVPGGGTEEPIPEAEEGAGTAYDPFAKGAVRVVARSCEALPGTQHALGVYQQQQPRQRLRSARHRAAQRARARARVGSGAETTMSATIPELDWELDLLPESEMPSTSTTAEAFEARALPILDTPAPASRASHPVSSTVASSSTSPLAPSTSTPPPMGRSRSIAHSPPRPSSPFPLLLRRTC